MRTIAYIIESLLVSVCFFFLLTSGYMSPEYLTHGQLTEKVDVYSYGVIVLEIVTGIQSNHFTADESLETLVTWVCHFSLLLIRKLGNYILSR